jgi:sulfite exporter TauE/SafE
MADTNLDYENKNHQARSTIRDNSRTKSDPAYSPRWDLSQERMFIENLLGQRITFMLVFVGLVANAAVQVRAAAEISAAIIIFGMILCYLIAGAIWRSQQKLDIIIQLIKMDVDHPLTVVDSLAGPDSRRKIIGAMLPWVCIGLLFCGYVFSLVAVFLR